MCIFYKNLLLESVSKNSHKSGTCYYFTIINFPIFNKTTNQFSKCLNAKNSIRLFHAEFIQRAIRISQSKFSCSIHFN